VAGNYWFFLYSGARIGTACRLRVKDFHQDGEEATVTLHEKGDKHRRIGLHFAAAEAIAAYIAKAELSKGAALSRPAQLTQQSGTTSEVLTRCGTKLSQGAFRSPASRSFRELSLTRFK